MLEIIGVLLLLGLAFVALMFVSAGLGALVGNVIAALRHQKAR